MRLDKDQLLLLAASVLGQLNSITYPFISTHTPEDSVLIRFPGREFNKEYQFKVDWPLVSWRNGLRIEPTFWLRHLKSKESVRIAYNTYRKEFRIL